MDFLNKEEQTVKILMNIRIIRANPPPIPPLFISDLPTTLLISFTEIHVLGLKSHFGETLEKHLRSAFIRTILE